MGRIILGADGRRYRCDGCGREERPIFLVHGRLLCAGCLRDYPARDAAERCLFLTASSRALCQQARERRHRTRPPGH